MSLSFRAETPPYRLEYSANGTFDDRQTLTVVNRRLPVPEFTRRTAKATRTLTLRTADLELTYTPQPGPGPAPAPDPAAFCFGSAGVPVCADVAKDDEPPSDPAAWGCGPHRSTAAPHGLPGLDAAGCCAACLAAADCRVWALNGSSAAGRCDLYTMARTVIGGSRAGYPAVVGGLFGPPAGHGFAPESLSVAAAAGAAVRAGLGGSA